MAVLGPSPTNTHRPKLPDHLLPANACVARAVGQQEMLSDLAAIVAMESEWNSLRKQGGKGVWDETLVREYRDVQQEALRDKRPYTSAVCLSSALKSTLSYLALTRFAK